MPFSEVRYTFSSSSPEAGAWRLDGLRAEEALSEPYVALVEVTALEDAADAAHLLGRDCTIEIARLPMLRRWRGIVHRVEQGAAVDFRVGARLHVVPALWALKQRVDSRIFQGKTVPEILDVVLGQGLAPYGRRLAKELARAYPRREYCVQYQESDFEFASRLMEEEGIVYSFSHEGDVELLVLTDRNEAFERVETMDGGPVPFDLRVGHRMDREHVHDFRRRASQTSTSVVVQDFDWTQPQAVPRDERRGTDEVGRDREIYDGSAELTIGDYASRKYMQRDAGAQSQLRRELAVRDATTGSGMGHVLGFAPGRRFDLSGHPDPELDGEHAIVRVVHASVPAPGDEGAESQRYHNRFETLPAAIAWRPAHRHAKRRIDGLQTAIVVGPSGEEIHVDEHGRIKIQFHWDRLAEWNDRSSCFVRVMQPWAGSGFGAMVIPRIGMEVVVSFLEGNPDRPLVTGCVYNGDNPPPLQLPDSKTQSTFKTNSSPGGAGFNELRFEDSAGREQVYLHAQKDLDETVLHDHSLNVLNDETLTVVGNQVQSIGVNQTETVGGNQTLSVVGNRTQTVTLNETITVVCNRSASITGSDSTHVVGSSSTTVDGGQATLSVTGNYDAIVSAKIKMSVGPTVVTQDTSSVTIDAPAQIQLRVGASTITLTPSEIHLDSPTIRATSSGATMLLDANAKIEKGSNHMLLDGNATLAKDDGNHVLLDGNATMKGAEAHVDGGATVNLKGGEATMSSGSATVTLDGDATVTGGTVKLNP